MTNEIDELEQQDMGQEASGAIRSGARANLVNAWRTQPLVKLLVLMVIVSAVAGVMFTLFSSSGSDRPNTTAVAAPPNVKEPVGGAESQFHHEQADLYDKSRLQEASANNGAFMPTPHGTVESKDDVIKQLEGKIDALTRKVETPRPQSQPQVQMQQPPAPEQFDESLAKAMQKQMADLETAAAPHGLKQVVVSSKSVAEEVGSIGEAAGMDHSAVGKTIRATATDGATPAASAAGHKPKIFVPAGTISYAKLLVEANSDVPGSVIAQIVSGPLAGARAVGSFQVASEYSDYLILKFKLAERDGKEYQINAVAIDPDTTLPGLSTDVDERYFTRVILPAAAAFVQGIGSSLSSNGQNLTTNGTTTVVSSTKNGITQGIYSGLGQGAQAVGQFFQNQANKTKPLIVVAAGTPMGLMFVTSLYEGAPEQTAFGQPSPSNYSGYSAPSGNEGGGFPFPGGGFSGLGAQGYGASPNQGNPYPGIGAALPGFSGFPSGYGTNSYGAGNASYSNAPQGYTVPNYLNLTSGGYPR